MSEKYNVCPCCGETSVEKYDQTCEKCLTPHNQLKSDSDEKIEKEYQKDLAQRHIYTEEEKKYTKYGFYVGYKSAHQSQQSVIDEAVELLKGLNGNRRCSLDITRFLQSIEDKS